MGWVKISERLPVKDRVYIACSASKGFTLLVYKRDKKGAEWGEKLGPALGLVNWIPLSKSDITHWLEFPDEKD